VTQLEQDLLQHLAADWDAQAAQIEREEDDTPAVLRDIRSRHALVLRTCSRDLRALLGRIGSGDVFPAGATRP